jgi:hypothetical protein
MWLKYAFLPLLVSFCCGAEIDANEIIKKSVQATQKLKSIKSLNDLKEVYYGDFSVRYFPKTLDYRSINPMSVYFILVKVCDKKAHHFTVQVNYIYLSDQKHNRQLFSDPDKAINEAKKLINMFLKETYISY